MQTIEHRSKRLAWKRGQAKAETSEPVAAGVDLFSRTGCAWPVTDQPPYYFCNKPRAGVKAYCQEHLAKVGKKSSASAEEDEI